MSKFSIIIPTFNEACNLPLLFSDLSIIREEKEIIVVDACSTDKTVDIANLYGVKLYSSKERNRGFQLDIGAKNANGEWLIFIHADSRLNKNSLQPLKSISENGNSLIYFFKFKIKNKKIIYRLLEVLVNIRSSFLKSPYGDQGLIINRKTYFLNKGFKNMPIMEDVDFIRRLRKKRNLKMLRVPIYTSSRKWENTNIALQAFKNWKLRRRWLNGESLKSIYFDYYKNN